MIRDIHPEIRKFWERNYKYIFIWEGIQNYTEWWGNESINSLDKNFLIAIRRGGDEHIVYNMGGRDDLSIKLITEEEALRLLRLKAFL